MTTHRNGSGSAALVLAAALFAACDKNTVQELPLKPATGHARKFFNFGANAPQVNFYADQQKLTAVQSGTGTEARPVRVRCRPETATRIRRSLPAPHTLTGRMPRAVDKDLPIATVMPPSPMGSTTRST